MKKILTFLLILILNFGFASFSKAADLTKLKSFINIIVSNKQGDTIKLNELKGTITSTLTLAIEKTKDLPATNEKKKDLLEILNYFLTTVDEAIENSKEVIIEEKKDWYKPNINTTWHWQLKGEIDLNKDVDVYVIDLFDTNISQVKTLQSKGKKVIAYFSAGSYEDWRTDANSFKNPIIGKKMSGWDEKWLDVRSGNIRDIMKKRLDFAKEKGFDGVEIDNVDGYTNDTGFPLTYDDQLKYNIFLSKEAHKRGLGIALKNDVEQIAELEPYFDFHINEECFEYNECEKIMPFIRAKKPVFHVEYDREKKDEICEEGNRRGFQTLILPLGLDDSFKIDCKLLK